ncbi:hypothetical protein PR202_ga08073 [Eleusine coracana subsp. coracana]|uniref:Uncharacterized protein n=1 Tax=Eleusine coracana subsp. coracana TaxID=191504 RepID=A0AAV5C1J5_ELECO|nr:hypothetical protein PR202_ga08073 [Eleusine coracana subsp. coracana]
MSPWVRGPHRNRIAIPTSPLLSRREWRAGFRRRRPPTPRLLLLEGLPRLSPAADPGVLRLEGRIRGRNWPSSPPGGARISLRLAWSGRRHRATSLAPGTRLCCPRLEARNVALPSSCRPVLLPAASGLVTSPMRRLVPAATAVDPAATSYCGGGWSQRLRRASAVPAQGLRAAAARLCVPLRPSVPAVATVAPAAVGPSSRSGRSTKNSSKLICREQGAGQHRAVQGVVVKTLGEQGARWRVGRRVLVCSGLSTSRTSPRVGVREAACAGEERERRRAGRGSTGASRGIGSPLAAWRKLWTEGEAAREGKQRERRRHAQVAAHTMDGAAVATSRGSRRRPAPGGAAA